MHSVCTESLKDIVARLVWKWEWVCGSYRRRCWIGLDGATLVLLFSLDGTMLVLLFSLDGTIVVLLLSLDGTTLVLLLSLDGM